jgi:hypothetical protein
MALFLDRFTVDCTAGFHGKMPHQQACASDMPRMSAGNAQNYEPKGTGLFL